MGNCDYYGDGLKPWEGWWIKDQGCNGRYHGWYYRLFMDPNFVSEVKARWKEVYPQLQTIPQWIEDEVKIMGVPVVAQWLTNPTRNHEVAGLVPALAQWVSDSALPRAVV